MKKHLFAIVLGLIFIVPTAIIAQTSESIVKGTHGGYIMNSNQPVNFEVVDTGTEIKFHTNNATSSTAKINITDVNITIVFLETTKTVAMENVTPVDGVYSVSPNRDYPIFMYSISYKLNGQDQAVKFRVPGSPQPR